MVTFKIGTTEYTSRDIRQVEKSLREDWGVADADLRELPGPMLALMNDESEPNRNRQSAVRILRHLREKGLLSPAQIERLDDSAFADSIPPHGVRVGSRRRGRGSQ